ncbi:hypothetical protein HK100_003841 [Physocladia obscura]|uniref:Protein kinase domain-containing protein n=1 Tax=Physocladia obscura TaxID=109957 RepID=A0AAD5XJP3_9FUNG|nr:hypothetical protein HK100_003841 [Physocladia obscura]
MSERILEESDLAQRQSRNILNTKLFTPPIKPRSESLRPDSRPIEINNSAGSNSSYNSFRNGISNSSGDSLQTPTALNSNFSSAATLSQGFVKSPYALGDDQQYHSTPHRIPSYPDALRSISSESRLRKPSRGFFDIFNIGNKGDQTPTEKLPPLSAATFIFDNIKSREQEEEKYSSGHFIVKVAAARETISIRVSDESSGSDVRDCVAQTFRIPPDRLGNWVIYNSVYFGTENAKTLTDDDLYSHCRQPNPPILFLMPNDQHEAFSRDDAKTDVISPHKLKLAPIVTQLDIPETAISDVPPIKTVVFEDIKLRTPDLQTPTTGSNRFRDSLFGDYNLPTIVSSEALAPLDPEDSIAPSSQPVKNFPSIHRNSDERPHPTEIVDNFGEYFPGVVVVDNDGDAVSEEKSKREPLFSFEIEESDHLEALISSPLDSAGALMVRRDTVNLIRQKSLLKRSETTTSKNSTTTKRMSSFGRKVTQLTSDNSKKSGEYLRSRISYESSHTAEVYRASEELFSIPEIAPEKILKKRLTTLEWKRKLTQIGINKGGLVIEVDESKDLDDEELRLSTEAEFGEGEMRESFDTMSSFTPSVKSQHEHIFGPFLGKPNHFQWTKGKLLGKGAYGEVYFGINVTSQDIMAVKQVKFIPPKKGVEQRKNSFVESLNMEIALLQELNHENITANVGFDFQDHTINLFLEYVEGGSLASIVSRYGKLDYNLARSFTCQILSGLDYLHERCIIHRDIKGANILVNSQGVVKIADFGISKKTDFKYQMNARNSEMKGSLNWMAPEVMADKGAYGVSADIWSLGCVVLEMLEGQKPWNNVDMFNLMQRVGKNGESPAIPRNFSDETVVFLKACFIREPSERPGADDLLRYPFTFADVDPGHPDFDYARWKDAAEEEQMRIHAMDSDSDNTNSDSD